MNQSRAYCPFCGSSVTTRYIEGRNRRYCEHCAQVLYRNPKPCAGVLVVENSQVLLVQRTNPPSPGSWSIPAGYMEWDESPRSAAVRELAEETGVEATSEAIQLLDTVFVEHPDKRHVLVVVYVISRARTTGDPTAGSDAGAARFWDLEQFRETNEKFEPGYESIIQFGQETAPETPPSESDREREAGNTDR